MADYEEARQEYLRKTYSKQQKIDLIKQIQSKQDQGATIKQACEEAGLHFTSYYAWRGQDTKGPRFQRTRKEKTEAVHRVDALMLKGQELEEACEHAGVSYSSYYRWRKGVKGRTKSERKIKHGLKPGPKPAAVHLNGSAAKLKAEIKRLRKEYRELRIKEIEAEVSSL